MNKEIRFSELVKTAGHPQTVALWTKASKDKAFMKSVRDNRVMTVIQQLHGSRKDFGLIEGTAKAVRERGAFDVARIRDIEREVHHETIAFLTNLAEHLGPEARFVHRGMTSSDVLDTCLAVQLPQASDLLLADLDAVLAALKKRAFEHKYTTTIARSHGVHAEPTTFGLKLVGHYAEFARNRDRLIAARKEIATCAISGAVGTFANIDPRVEEYVAKKLAGIILERDVELPPDSIVRSDPGLQPEIRAPVVLAIEWPHLGGVA